MPIYEYTEQELYKISNALFRKIYYILVGTLAKVRKEEGVRLETKHSVPSVFPVSAFYTHVDRRAGKCENSKKSGKTGQ